MNFGLIGAAGYIAPRHMKAIKETGNKLVAALDPSDSVGIIDSYFPNADFFTEPERFDRHLDKLRRSGETKIDYVSICSPNYLHDAHIRMALRNRAHAICEKPVVLNTWNIDALCDLEKETGLNIYTILQLRLHPAILELKSKVQSQSAYAEASTDEKEKVERSNSKFKNSNSNNLSPEKEHSIKNTEQRATSNEQPATSKKYNIELNYITSRGKWYDFSWKGDRQKSGGVATNIGVHFFDMLSWIFGDVINNTVSESLPNKTSGILELEKAKVNWFLSIDYNDIPNELKQKGLRTYRSLKINEQDIEFSDGFTDLHTLSYAEILNGNGFTVSEARRSVEIVNSIRSQID